MEAFQEAFAHTQPSPTPLAVLKTYLLLSYKTAVPRQSELNEEFTLVQRCKKKQSSKGTHNKTALSPQPINNIQPFTTANGPAARATSPPSVTNITIAPRITITIKTNLPPVHIQVGRLPGRVYECGITAHRNASTGCACAIHFHVASPSTARTSSVAHTEIINFTLHHDSRRQVGRLNRIACNEMLVSQRTEMRPRAALEPFTFTSRRHPPPATSSLLTAESGLQTMHIHSLLSLEKEGV
ncbi:hypothetical protein ACJJTC_004363 [Scirpophaga incertulas]